MELPQDAKYSSVPIRLTFSEVKDYAQKLADVMNEIEAAGFILYPHPRPVGISIRQPRSGYKKEDCNHPDLTTAVVRIWDEGDGEGWKVKLF